MATSNELNLVSTLEALQIPREFARYDSLNEIEVIVRLEEWRRRAYVVLSELADKYRAKDNLTLEEQARLVATTATFDGNGPWVLDTTRLLAQDILASYASPDARLLELILQDHVKTIFQTNPHPSLNPATGRKLPRSTGGTFAQLDHLEGQSWKGYPGAPNIISWCIRHTEAVAYEKLWYLIIPPTMTLLDDYETSNKLRGVHLVAELLDRVPGDLLRRTGVDGLLFSSLKTSMTFLQNPETPSLIRAAVSTSISLIHKTTTRESAARFDQLCSILGDGIIGSIWVYATRNPDALEASLDVLPEIVDALGIGTVRYLKAIIPS
ncbi:hypothetical protein A0H81_08168 [Grifola frondosa]|uniref:Uncharacterized protein n=1 Tax=Grifola frondosa TaxID=5627 RepID=A0A1C7MA42_GRIFR|nr:hypothetical protein A0H81_08168 [Grifola frondosa]